MTTQSAVGSRLCSAFSLRPPLPKGVGTDGAETVRNPIDAAHNSNPKGPTRIGSQPPVSFLFRMYVACHVLRLSTETRFTALVLFHRYVQAKQGATTEQREEWPWIGAVCLFLACKTEDEPRRLRDIINMAQMVLSSSNTTATGADFGSNKDQVDTSDETILDIDVKNTPPLDGAYWDSKRKAIEIEQMVLRWLGFDCSVSHPHRAVFWILDQMFQPQTVGSEASSREAKPSSEPIHQKNLLDTIPISRKRNRDNATAGSYKGSDRRCKTQDELLSSAFRHLNDALFHPRTLQWGVVELACAAIDLAVEDRFEEGSNSATTDSIGKSSGNTHEDDTKPPGKEFYCKAIFKDEWWQRYEVSNNDFEDCRNDLKKSTANLRAMAKTEKEGLETSLSINLPAS